MSSVLPVDPERDSRMVSELINAALADFPGDDAWQAIAAIHFRATWEVCERAKDLSRSVCATERGVAASMLAQLGVSKRVYQTECQEILRGMLHAENDDDVLDSIICALGHQSPADLPNLLSRFTTHSDAEMRWRVASALYGHNSDLAIEHLLKLSSDADPDVRDWATFGLGNSNRDTPEIRQALLDRVNDSDCDTRGEALCGLVRLNHPDVAAMVERELDTSEQISNFTLDAAELLAAPELVPHLQELQAIEGNDYDKFQRVIDACSQS